MSSGRSARADEDWQRARDKAEEALRLQADSTEARALKQEAEAHLVPTIRFRTFANGSEVAAAVASGTETFASGEPLTMKEGSRYRFSFTYTDPQGKAYSGAYEVPSAEKGLKVVEVESHGDRPLGPDGGRFDEPSLTGVGSVVAPTVNFVRNFPTCFGRALRRNF